MFIIDRFSSIPLELGRFYTAPRSDEPVDENDERQYTQRSSKNDNEDRSSNSSYQQQEGRHSREVIPAEVKRKCTKIPSITSMCFPPHLFLANLS